MSLPLVIGCGPAATGGGPVHSGETIVVAAPEVPRAEFGVVPAALGDHGVWKKIRHRARVATTGAARLTAGGAVANESRHDTKIDERPIYPVIGESSDAIRVVVDDDKARIALWIPRADASPTALAVVRVADASGRADKVSGVTLGAGAELDAKPAANGLREISLHDEFLDAHGFVPAAAIGEVWVAGEREEYDPSEQSRSEPAPVSTGMTLAPGPIRIGAADRTDVVATVKQKVPVRVIAQRGSWTEVEVHVRRVRVHGFVPAAAVAKEDDFSTHGTGHGHGYGISDTLHVVVSAGACIYDRPQGEVIGVEVQDDDRYSHGAVEPGWWAIYVGTDWGLMLVAAKEMSGSKNPKETTWESCAK